MDRLSKTTAQIITAIFLTSAAGLTFANDINAEANYKGEACCPPCACLDNGPYIGLQIGYDSYRIRDKLNIGFPLGVHHTSIINATGPVGGLLLGYGYFIRNFWYFGSEIFGNYSGADTRVNAVVDFPFINYFLKVRTRSSWGISFLGGVKLNNAALGYIRLGYNWANFKAEEQGNFLGLSLNNTRTHTGSGFNFGFGMDALIEGPWSVRGEYTHTSYTSLKMRSRVTVNHPSDNQVMLAGIYRFFC